MDIYWLGQACFKIKGKSTTVVIDPFNPQFTGLKVDKDLSSDVVLVSHQHQDHNFTQGVDGDPIIFSGPGEYEIKGVSITGVASFHDKVQGQDRGKNTIYHIFMDGVNLVHLGDLGHVLTDDQMNLVEITDILMVPVGSVYTIDAKDAARIIEQLEPRVVIPMHYKLPGLKFELDEVDKFLKEMGAEGVTPQPKLLITKEKLPEETQVILLTKSS